MMENKNEIMLFKHEEFGEVRTLVIDGEPWFVGKDVAEILGYSNTRKAVIPQLIGNENNHRVQLACLNAEKSAIDSKIAADTSQQEKQRAVSEAETNIQEAKKRFIKAQTDENSEVIDYIQSLEKEKADIHSKILLKETESERLSEETERMKKKREDLIIRYKKESEKKYNGDEVCPCCGQPLPKDKIETAKTEFNLQKARTLEAISQEGQKYNQLVIAENKGKFDELTREITVLKTAVIDLDEQIKKLKNEINSKIFEDMEEYKELVRQLDEIKAKPVDDTLNQFRKQSEELSDKIAEETRQIALFKAAENARSRISELENQKEQLAAEYARCEKGEYLCELFIRTKVSMLDERINSHFKTIRFKLFHNQANGGLSEVCKVLIPCESGLVEYEKANNAAKINAGLEMINILSEHFGVHLPVFVDNAESVTAFTDCDSQIIRLIVSEKDKTLRTEIIQ